MDNQLHVAALCGGVGGAKLARGLVEVLPPEALTVIVNTGDDFTHIGLDISPDVDTVIYTLSDMADRHRGWGLSGESWSFMDALRKIGGETWFQLGDRDLATHVERTHRMRQGQTLSDVTAALAAAHGIGHAIAPMSDDPVRTMVMTVEGELTFQEYFVREQCRPPVSSIRFAGSAAAHPSPAFGSVLDRKDIGSVIICPSNPLLSIDPILVIPGVHSRLRSIGAPIVAISPIVGGKSIKGPTAKLMEELGIAPTTLSIAAHYGQLIDAIVIDEADAADAAALEALGLAVLVTKTVMSSIEDSARLASQTVDFVSSLAAHQ